jgi:hypothetical protein
MALTYTQLSQAIQDYCESSETTFVNNIPVFVQQAEDRINRSVVLPAYIKNVFASVTAGNRYISTPSDFLAQFSMTILDDSGQYVNLNEVDTSFIREAYDDIAEQGIPQYYSLFNNASFILGPTPDQDYTVNLEYYYEPPSIVVTGTSWLGDHADSCLLYACLIEAYTYLKGEPALLQLYDAKYKENLARLKTLGEGYNNRDNFRRRDFSVPVT